ncbi:MAG: hypothetical protein AB9856_14460 [Cellulosilyticaceae bacterium]
MIIININKEINNILKDIGYPVSFLINNSNPKPEVWIVFNKLGTTPNEHCNDKEVSRTHYVQINIYAKYEMGVETLKDEIINRMKANSWGFQGGQADIYESDTNIVGTPLEFIYEEQL